MSTTLTYAWLQQNGFHKLERLERQPTDHYRRCLGNELINERFMSAREDVCLDVASNGIESRDFWYVWLTRASSQNFHPSVWLHVRHIYFVEELVLMYEAITGRKFGPPAWKLDELGEPLFQTPETERKS